MIKIIDQSCSLSVYYCINRNIFLEKHTDLGKAFISVISKLLILYDIAEIKEPAIDIIEPLVLCPRIEYIATRFKKEVYNPSFNYISLGILQDILQSKIDNLK